MATPPLGQAELLRHKQTGWCFLPLEYPNGGMVSARQVYGRGKMRVVDLENTHILSLESFEPSGFVVISRPSQRQVIVDLIE